LRGHQALIELFLLFPNGLPAGGDLLAGGVFAPAAEGKSSRA
jgi:hypothetical protein